MTRERDVEALADLAVEVYGGFEVACNVAGGAQFGYLVAMDETAWNYTVTSA